MVHAWISCQERGQGAGECSSGFWAGVVLVMRAKGHPIQQEVPTEALWTVPSLA